MTTVAELRQLLVYYADDTLVGIAGKDLILRRADSGGWEEEIEIGTLDPVEEPIEQLLYEDNTNNSDEEGDARRLPEEPGAERS